MPISALCCSVTDYFSCSARNCFARRLEWGGSRLRPEATGFGTVFFAKELLADEADSLVGKRCLVSGSG